MKMTAYVKREGKLEAFKLADYDDTQEPFSEDLYEYICEELDPTYKLSPVLVLLQNDAND